jgi:hypothetical protein
MIVDMPAAIAVAMEDLGRQILGLYNNAPQTLRGYVIICDPEGT